MKISKSSLMWKFHERWFDMDRYAWVNEVDICGYFWLSVGRLVYSIWYVLVIYSVFFLLGFVGLESMVLLDPLLQTSLTLSMLVIPLSAVILLVSLVITLVTYYEFVLPVLARVIIEPLGFGLNWLIGPVITPLKYFYNKLCFKVTLED